MPDEGDRQDPSSLTTEALHREVNRLEQLIAMRIDGMEEVQNERFQRIDQQFGLVEQQRVEQKQDTKAAVDAALTAQKEAVKEQTTASERAIAKSETATTKSIEQLGTAFTTEVAGLRRELGDLKDRITAAESQKVGGAEARAASALSFGQMVALIGVVLTVVGLLVALG